MSLTISLYTTAARKTRINGAQDDSRLLRGMEASNSPKVLRVVGFLNAARVAGGLSPLVVHPGLMSIAQEVVLAWEKRAGAGGYGIPGDAALQASLAARYYGGNVCEAYAVNVPSHLHMTAGFLVTQMLRPDVMAVDGVRRIHPMNPAYRTVGIAEISHKTPYGFTADTHLMLLGAAEPDGGCVLPVYVTPRRDALAAPGPVIFPVVGGAQWRDTWGQAREGHRHEGQDLMAPKMRPLVACFDGVVGLILDGSGRSSPGNMITLEGENGWLAKYMHVNCDTPGTRDGRGGARFAFAPGLLTGDYVRAGQALGYVGDSGNARGGPPHCHFEIAPRGSVRSINAAPFLKAARVLKTAVPPLGPAERAERAGRLPTDGEVQVSGSVVSLTPGRILLRADGVLGPQGAAKTLAPPRDKTVVVSGDVPANRLMGSGTRLSAVGPDHGPGSPLEVSWLIIRL